MKSFTTIFAACVFVLPGLTLAHGGEDHLQTAQPRTSKLLVSEDSLDAINQRYLSQVKSIFEKKCFACHGEQIDMPWYSRIPGPKQLIQWDIDKAKEHMDMTNEFPFKGHGGPVKDLKAIIKTVEKGNMPPLRYKVLHWDSSLEFDEVDLIKDWAQDGLKLLQQTQNLQSKPSRK